MEVTCFSKLSADQLLVLIDHSLGSIMKRPYNKLLINLIRSIITGKSHTLALINWPRYRSVNTPTQGLGSVISLLWPHSRLISSMLYVAVLHLAYFLATGTTVIIYWLTTVVTSLSDDVLTILYFFIHLLFFSNFFLNHKIGEGN